MPTLPRSHRRLGFTLIEVMVTIGVIVLLAAIAFPVFSKIIASGKRARVRGDMGAIVTALEAYKADHGGQYPGQVAGGIGPDSGFAVLGRELVGVYGDHFLPVPPNPPNTINPAGPPAFDGTKTYKPGDAVFSTPNTYVAMVAMVPPMPAPTPTAPFTNWAPCPTDDGLDGPGQRLGVNRTGKKAGPYLQTDKIKVQGSAFVDGEGKPILYFPARGNLNINKTTTEIPEPYVSLAARSRSKYVADDNIQFFTRFDDAVYDPNALQRIRAMLGDTNTNGVIDPGESAVATAGYILWAPGPDGFYGVRTTPSATPPNNLQVSKCDDVIEPSSP